MPEQVAQVPISAITNPRFFSEFTAFSGVDLKDLPIVVYDIPYSGQAVIIGKDQGDSLVSILLVVGSEGTLILFCGSLDIFRYLLLIVTSLNQVCGKFSSSFSEIFFLRAYPAKP